MNPPRLATIGRWALLVGLFLGLAASALGLAAVGDQWRARTRGVVSGLPPADLAPRPNPFAVNTEFAAESPSALDAALAQLRSAGFAWIRQPFSWAAIEPARGRFDWSDSDRLVEAARAHDLRIIAVLRDSPGWASGRAAASTRPPENPDDFAAFALAFAARYADRVDVYQIWDEPNLSLGWGGRDVAPAEYARLLQAGYQAIHAADPDATVLLGALAPTVEQSAANLSDILYLRALYDLGAAEYFDGVAGKPYGFDTGPEDRRADADLLNFSRFVLLREEMVRHGDERKLLWGGAFGWNSLPAGWGGGLSLWGQTDEATQARRTADAYRRAIAEWPWAGALALDVYRPAAPADDPRWGFALVDAEGRPRPTLDAVFGLATEAPAAIPGNHPASDPAARYTGGWEFSSLGADIGGSGDRVDFTFQGTDLALTVRRANYRAYLYIAIDGQPADLLPRDERGAYLVLTSPDLTPRVDTIPVTSGLADGIHTAEIVAERGWDQWALVGFSVGRTLDLRGYRLAALALSVTTLASAAALTRFALHFPPSTLHFPPSTLHAPRSTLHAAFNSLGDVGQSIAAAAVAAVLYLSAWLTWGVELAQVVRRYGDTAPLLLTALTAGVFYYSPWFLLTLLSLALLFGLLYLRLDLGLALIAFFAPFYLLPRPMWDKAFSMVEICTLLTALAWGLHTAPRLFSTLRANHSSSFIPERAFSLHRSSFLLHRLSLLDWSTLAFVLISAASIFVAEIRGVAVREFRVMVLEPALFYLMLRTAPLDRKAVWRIVDAFVLSGVLVAAVGLYEYHLGVDVITAEGGVGRLRSVYGSPNNVGLYLGRIAPILAAVALMGRERARRLAYLAAMPLLAEALRLSLSKGALVLGLPLSLAFVLLFWGGRRAVMALSAGAAAFVAAGAALMRNPRFAQMFDLQAGTSFFRIRLWQSAWAMFLDHPWLGVGLDNFLYAYRGRYINPEAWKDPNLSHAHNVVLDFLTRLGAPGMAAFAAMQAGFWRLALRSLAQADPSLAALSVGLMGSMVDFLAHGLVDASYWFVDLAFVYFLTLGLIGALCRGVTQRRIADFAEALIAR